MPGKDKDKDKEGSAINFLVGDALWSNIFKKDGDRDEACMSLLKSVPLFGSMGKSELRELVRIMHKRSYGPEETVFYEGEPGVGMYIVQEGTVAIYKGDSAQKSEQLAELKRGEFFGELALLDESPRSASAVAVESCRILALFRADLLELVNRKPRLGNKLLFELAHLIGERLKYTNEELQAVWARLDDSKVIT